MHYLAVGSTTREVYYFVITISGNLGPTLFGDKYGHTHLYDTSNPQHSFLFQHLKSITMPQSTRDSSAISSIESPPPPLKRRRRRPARSCEQCRRRKIRCSLGQPCNGCVRARVPMQCSYRDGSPVEAAPETRTLAPAETRAVRDEVITTPQNQTNTTGYPRDHVSRLSRPDENNTSMFSRENHVSQIVSSPQISIPTPSSTSIPPFTPRLRHVPEKTKLFGQTHWLHTAEKVSCFILTPVLSNSNMTLTCL